jgi:hypothetical protein
VIGRVSDRSPFSLSSILRSFERYRSENVLKFAPEGAQVSQEVSFGVKDEVDGVARTVESQVIHLYVIIFAIRKINIHSCFIFKIHPEEEA